jgi:beta-galactosidase/beta-glucuronidase
VESALSGVKKPVMPDQRLWYRRTFDKPAIPAEGRLLLHFGAVDWQCTVWVNGKQVGEHKGGYDPFHFDVTDALRDGPNELVVAVWDPTDTGFQPRGKQVLKPQGIWYTAVTGIWQTVWLEPTPRQAIESLSIVPDVDNGAASVTVVAPAGTRVRLVASSDGEQVATAEGSAREPVKLAIPSPKLWSPDAPHLYDLRAELVADGGRIDSVESYFGLRKIEVRKDEAGVNRLMLNGQPLFQYGPLDQGWWPDGLYTPASDAALKYDIEMTKKLGMNMARKHVKLEIPRWYYWCDKLGLLVWQDMPSANVDRDNAESKANFRRELQSLVDAMRNHPSIVMWVPFNEGWGQHDVRDTVAWLEAYDPSRPVNEASGWHDRGAGSISDMHSYPGPGMRPVELKRAVVLGEFGGLGMPVAGHTWQDEANWGYVSYTDADKLTQAYVDLLQALRPLIDKGLSAAVYTQTSDVEIEVNGLMTYDRARVKMDLQRIGAAARELYESPSKVAATALSRRQLDASSEAAE